MEQRDDEGNSEPGPHPEPSNGSSENPKSDPELGPDPLTEPSDRRPAQFARRVSLALTALLLAGTGLLVVRGTLASEAPLAPTRVDDGVQTQLHQGPHGAQIQAALVVAHPVADVWEVVTAYEAFGDLFEPPFWDLQIEDATWSADRRTCALRGQAVSKLLTVPVDVVVLHELREDGARIASWDDSAGGRVNRGRWLLTPLDSGRTRIVYEAQVSLPRIPQFLVNDVLLAEVGFVVGAVRDHLGRAP